MYSREKPIKVEKNTKKLFNTNDKLSSQAITKETLNNQRLGSISFVPSVAGLIIAGEVVKDLINLNKFK